MQTAFDHKKIPAKQQKFPDYYLISQRVIILPTSFDHRPTATSKLQLTFAHPCRQSIIAYNNSMIGIWVSLPDSQSLRFTTFSQVSVLNSDLKTVIKF